MKKIAALILALMFVFSLAAGCKSPAQTEAPAQAQSGETNTSGEAAKPAAEGEKKDTLVVAMPSFPNSIDMYQIQGSGSGRFVKTVYEGLVRVDENGEIAPMLAESWEISDDGMEYTFKLKEGVKWHNGEELTSDDVVFTVETCKTTSSFAAVWSPVKKAEAIDKYNVRILMEYPYAPFLNALAGASAACVTNRNGTAAAANDFGAVCGTGPYRIDSYVTGEKINFVAFEDWHGGEVPIKNLTFRTIVDTSTAVIALEKGEVDVMIEIADIDRAVIQANDKLKLDSCPSYKVTYLGFNTEHPIYSNNAVREAISYAINKQGALDIVREGYGTVAQNFLIDGLFGYDASIKGPDLDIEKAKQLLADAGYPNGFNTVINVKEGADSKVAQVMQENLRQININAEIQVLELSAFTEAAERGDCELIVNTWSSPVADADYSLYFLFHSANIGMRNLTRCNNPKIDEYLDSGRQNADPAIRQQKYTALLQELVDYAPAVPIFFEVSTIAYNAGLKNVKPVPTTEYHYVDFSW